MGTKTKPSLCIVGASGLVGQQLCLTLEKQGWGPQNVQITPRADVQTDAEALRAFSNQQIVFLVLPETESKRLAPLALQAGADLIDLSNAFRLGNESHLVLPRVNDSAFFDSLETCPQIFACPNCTVVGPALILHALQNAFGLADVVLTTFQSKSGLGRLGLELFSESDADISPVCGTLTPNDWSSEEISVHEELRSLLQAPRLSLSATCTRVPIDRGHAASMTIRTHKDMSLAAVQACLSNQKGIALKPANEPPTPNDSIDADDVLIGRIRVLEDGRLSLWACWDNLFTGAALPATHIAELVLASRKENA